MGRYDASRTLRYNVAISPPIMSRFDLFFVILDQKDEIEDELIAKHIVNMHRERDQFVNQSVFSKEQLQTFIKITR